MAYWGKIMSTGSVYRQYKLVADESDESEFNV